MKRIAVVGALGFLASGLMAQGLNPVGQTKETWEEINFEFNSSVLSDGYPSLLRLADLLTQHRDYHVKLTGNTDSVGSVPYNEKLSLARAEAVKAFLVKYGARADQLTTAGNGKSVPEVDNKTKEGRFMNRRVVLALTDGTGKLIKEGGISDVLPVMTALQDMAKKQQDCCDQILKRLDKLDDILAALKNLQGENERLKTELGDLRNQQNALKDQVNGMPKAVTEPQARKIADASAQNTASQAASQAAAKVEEAEKSRNKILSNVGVNVGPAYGAGRTGSFTASANGQLFAPFGADRMYAVQAQAEYMYYPGRQEGQFDLGLVNRMGNFQAGGFASFKYLNFSNYQNGGALGQAAVMVDYLFDGGKVGFFGTKGFKNYAVLNSVTLAPGAYFQTYARIADQAGIDALVGVWGKAYLQGDIGLIVSHTRSDQPGGSLKLIQPVSEHVAFTAELGYNETYLNAKNSGRAVVGLAFGGLVNPQDFAKIKSPVPMEIPRIRYELGTRRVGSSPPIADAGPSQLNVSAGTITLDGSGSYDPLGETLTYNWVQISGPTATLSSPTTPKTTFNAVAGASYAFRLTVKNTDGLQASATTQVTTLSPGQVQILQFSAAPATITAGQSSTLNWVVQNATSVTITPTLGSVNASSGTSSVTPAATTTYTLTATGPGGTVNSTVTVTVGTVAAGNPQIIRFEANPVTIAPGQQSTLSWTTTGAATVSINPVLGNQPLNGSATVSPAQTTTYTLTATSSDGHAVTAPVTVTVAPGTIPQIVVFVANPQTISTGQSTRLCWQVIGATSISIAPGIGSNLNANDCATVSPQQTTTYTLTASNATGQIQANTTVNVGQVQILSFTATPSFSPAQGAPVVLAWQTLNATSVIIIGPDLVTQGLPVNGSITINPMQNNTYTLTAYGPGGQTTSVVISVYVR
ncbi:MAG: OmpA family protein [Bryobacteraceae bacterium]